MVALRGRDIDAFLAKPDAARPLILLCAQTRFKGEADGCDTMGHAGHSRTGTGRVQQHGPDTAVGSTVDDNEHDTAGHHHYEAAGSKRGDIDAKVMFLVDDGINGTVEIVPPGCGSDKNRNLARGTGVDQVQKADAAEVADAGPVEREMLRLDGLRDIAGTGCGAGTRSGRELTCVRRAPSGASRSSRRRTRRAGDGRESGSGSVPKR